MIHKPTKTMMMMMMIIKEKDTRTMYVYENMYDTRDDGLAKTFLFVSASV